MRTLTTTVCTFAELSEKAQERAIDKLRNINVDYEWYESTLDHYKDVLKEKGFEGAKIHFSGFWSQGDGACFDAKINLEKFCSDKRLLKVAEECSFEICKTSFANHYNHENTRYIEYYDIFNKRQTNLSEAIKELSEEIESIRLSECKKIYRSLEKSYEYLTSNEAIIETIEANEYEFTESGELI